MNKFKPSFSVGFNGKKSDLQKIIDNGLELESIYSGGLHHKIAGGRPQYAGHLDELRECIDLAHSIGYKYEIALNTSCGLHDKTDKAWWADIEDYLKVLEACGVDRIIASHPFLMTWVKSKTKMEVVASTICEVTEPRMARYYEELGADILIPSMNVNYRLDKLAAIKAALSHTKLRIMLNEHCLGDCPWRRFHHSHYAHSNYEMDYHLNCKRKFLDTPHLSLTNNSIRPEDMVHYQDLTDNFKIVGRLVPVGQLIERITAYGTQHYDGNFIRLSDHKLGDIIHIPNKQLDGIFEMKSRCDFNCDSCNYCRGLYEDVAAKRRGADYETVL